jgi:hypothetical protein
MSLRLAYYFWKNAGCLGQIWGEEEKVVPITLISEAPSRDLSYAQKGIHL